MDEFYGGVQDIDIEINRDTENNNSPPQENKQNLHQNFTKVTVTFAVTTESLAWITIQGGGTVYPAFGGTGTTQEGVNEYTEQAVEIWRAIIGDPDAEWQYQYKESNIEDISGLEISDKILFRDRTRPCEVVPNNQ
jgi:hypothetical protein